MIRIIEDTKENFQAECSHGPCSDEFGLDVSFFDKANEYCRRPWLPILLSVSVLCLACRYCPA